MARLNIWNSEPDIQFAAIDEHGRNCGSAEIPGTVVDGDRAQIALICELDGVFWGLVLEWNDDVAERCGVARLNKDIKEVCLTPDQGGRP